MTGTATIRDVTEATVERARDFLEAHVETSLFLLSNLTTMGHRLGDELNSGNFRFMEKDDEVQAVFVLTRRGILLAETGGRTDLAAAILRSVEADPAQLGGVVGEWRAAESLWRILCADPRFHPTSVSKENLYRLDLASAPPEGVRDEGARVLTDCDFERWEPLSTAYAVEVELPVQGTAAQRRSDFERQASESHWWGVFDGPRLVAIAGLNAVYKSLGQVGGVYTIPDARRLGLSRRVMETLLSDSVTRHRLEKLVLFTGEENVGASRLYESLGFERIGHFALFFGARSGDSQEGFEQT